MNRINRHNQKAAPRAAFLFMTFLRRASSLVARISFLRSCRGCPLRGLFSWRERDEREPDEDEASRAAEKMRPLAHITQ